MNLVVNGQPREFPERITVTELLAAMGLEGRPCAVERNQSVVSRADHDSTRLAEGDLVELVTLVGGG